MIRTRFWVLGSAAAVLLFLGAFLFSSPPVAEATLVVAEGEVAVEHSTTRLLVVPAREQRTLAAGSTLALSAGDTIQLGQDATAQLRFLDGSTVDLSRGALLHITEFVDTGDAFRVRLYQFAGRSVNRVAHLIDADDAFVISTPSSTTSVRGTLFSVNVVDARRSEVAVDEGLVLVTTEVGSTEVPAGYQLRIEAGQPLEVEPQPHRDGGAPPVASIVDGVRAGKAVPHGLDPCIGSAGDCVGIIGLNFTPRDEPTPAVPYVQVKADGLSDAEKEAQLDAEALALIMESEVDRAASAESPTVLIPADQPTATVPEGVPAAAPTGSDSNAGSGGNVPDQPPQPPGQEDKEPKADKDDGCPGGSCEPLPPPATACDTAADPSNPHCVSNNGK